MLVLTEIVILQLQSVHGNTEYCSNDDYFNDEEVFIQAMMIATLAEKFSMTDF